MPPAFDWTRFAGVADRIAPDFVSRTAVMTELVDSSLLFSDGLCFCALCELFEVEQILEAGTGFGGSTEMFARYFADDPRVRSIWSVDEAVNPRWQRLLAILRLKRYSRFVWSSDKRARYIARARLQPFSRVTLARGDAFQKLPGMVRRAGRDRVKVGILIDGPKGESQLELAEAMLRLSPLVAFVAVDDIGPMFDVEGRHARFCASPYAVFATSDRRYFERYGAINAGRVPPRMLANPEHPGYGMGVLVNQ